MITRLSPSGLKRLEQVRQDFRCTVPGDTTTEMLLRPEFWSQVARKVHAFDTIEVLTDDGSRRWTLLVLVPGDLWAKVHVLTDDSFGKPKTAKEDKPSDEDKEFRVEFKGSKRHCVIRLSDKSIVFSGGERREDAEAWIEKYRATVNG